MTLWALVVLIVAVLIRNRSERNSKGVVIGNILSVIPRGIFFYSYEACQDGPDENSLVNSDEDTSIYSPSIVDLNSTLILSPAISALRIHYILVLEHVKTPTLR